MYFSPYYRWGADMSLATNESNWARGWKTEADSSRGTAAKQGTCFSLLALQIHNTFVAVPQRNIHEGIKVDLYIFNGYSLK